MLFKHSLPNLPAANNVISPILQMSLRVFPEVPSEWVGKEARKWHFSSICGFMHTGSKAPGRMLVTVLWRRRTEWPRVKFNWVWTFSTLFVITVFAVTFLRQVLFLCSVTFSFTIKLSTDLCIYPSHIYLLLVLSLLPSPFNISIILQL